MIGFGIQARDPGARGTGNTFVGCFGESNELFLGCSNKRIKSWNKNVAANRYLCFGRVSVRSPRKVITLIIDKKIKTGSSVPGRLCLGLKTKKLQCMSVLLFSNFN